MSTPRELFRRANMPVQPQRDVQTEVVEARMPLQSGDCMPKARTIPREESGSAAAPDVSVMRVIVPQQIGGHSVYRQLMRIHDRMSSQHLEG